MDKQLVKLINEQINKELYSAYLYLDMANYYKAESLNGFGNWFTVQAQEERDHAMLFSTYLLDSNERVELYAIDAPSKKYESFSEPLSDAYAHEQFVTASINDIYHRAHEVKDYRAMQFLDWFVKEQGEEEKSSNELIDKYRLFASDGKGLYMLDTELAARMYTPPSLQL